MFCLSLLLPVLVFNPNTIAERLPIQIYSTADGLAHQRVRRIVRDSRGFLWFCTIDGLSWFDGYRFTTYRKEDGLPSSSINDLIEGGGGVYWIATREGLSRFDPISENRGGIAYSHFNTYRIGTDPATNRVEILHRDKMGRVWVGTDSGMFRLIESGGQVSLERVELGGLSMIRSIGEDEDGGLWIGSSEGLIRLAIDGRRTRFVCRTSELATAVHAVLPDRDGIVWFSVGTKIFAFKPSPTGADQQESEIVIDPGIVTRSGDLEALGATIASLKTGGAVGFTAGSGIDNAIRSIYKAVDGRLWISTGGSGAEVFDGHHLRHYNEDQGLAGNAINTFAEDSDNNLWFGSDTGGALKLTRNGFVGFFTHDGLIHTWIGSIFEQGANNFYVLSGNDFINQFDGRGFSAVRLRIRGYSSGLFRAGLQDHLGAWWIATPNGLSRFSNINQLSDLNRKRPQIYTDRDGLAAGQVTGLFEDSRGDMWVFSRANGAATMKAGVALEMPKACQPSAASTALSKIETEICGRALINGGWPAFGMTGLKK